MGNSTINKDEPVTNVGLFLALSIVLFSTGHWVGGINAFIVVLFKVYGDGD